MMNGMSRVDQIKQGERTRKAIRKFVTTYSKKNHGLSPSLQEIAAGIGVASHNAVRAHLVQMRDRGELTWQDGKGRTLRLLEPKAPRKAS